MANSAAETDAAAEAATDTEAAERQYAEAVRQQEVLRAAERERRRTLKAVSPPPAGLSSQLEASSSQVQASPSSSAAAASAAMVREVTATGGVKFTPLVVVDDDEPPPKAKSPAKSPAKAAAGKRGREAEQQQQQQPSSSSSAPAEAPIKQEVRVKPEGEPSPSAPPSLWWHGERGGALGFVPNLSGAIFLTNTANEAECLQRGLFGLPSNQKPLLKRIEAAHERTLLFLFNFQRRVMLGAFVAAGPAGFPLQRSAWAPRGGETPFPSQIPVAWHGARFPSLRESKFRHVVKYTSGNRFEQNLSAAQTKQLVTLFVEEAQDVEDGEIVVSAGPISRRRPISSQPLGSGAIRKPQPKDLAGGRWQLR